MAGKMYVEQGKVREFAKATGSTNPAYLGDDAIMPPTFLMTAGLWATPENEADAVDVGFDPQRILHGEQEFEFYGPPPRVGQALFVTGRLDSRWEKEGKRGGTMRFAKLVTEYRDADSGELLVEERITLIETAKPPAQEERA